MTRIVGRRAFLEASAVAGLAPAVPAWLSPLGAQSRGAVTRTRIDTHHHVFPPPYVAALAAAKLDDPIARAWAVTRTLDDMEEAGVETAILPVTQPALSFADRDTARRVARDS